MPSSLVDATGSIVEANHVAGRMLGYRREELIGRSIEDLIPVAQRAAHVVRREGLHGAARPEDGPGAAVPSRLPGWHGVAG